MPVLVLEHASIGELKQTFFTLCPEPDEMSFDAAKVTQCATALLEIRRRAVAKRDVALLNDFTIMLTDLRNSVATIRQTQKATPGAGGGILLVPGDPEFKLP